MTTPDKAAAAELGTESERLHAEIERLMDGWWSTKSRTVPTQLIRRVYALLAVPPDADAQKLVAEIDEALAQKYLYRPQSDKLLLRAKAILAAREAGPGREPTQDMVYAGIEVMRVTGGNLFADIRNAWRAMYDAAPKSAQTPEQELIAAACEVVSRRGWTTADAAPTAGPRGDAEDDPITKCPTCGISSPASMHSHLATCSSEGSMLNFDAIDAAIQAKGETR